jgi:uncharacterized repeat protein (TIGR04042 family)
VRWPDGHADQGSCPSPVVQQWLQPGEHYAVAEFVDHARTALMLASSRVQRLYGFPCPVSAAQLSRLEQEAARYDPEQVVTVLSLG